MRPEEIKDLVRSLEAMGQMDAVLIEAQMGRQQVIEGMSDSSKRPTWWFILLSSKWVISGLYPLAGKVLLIHLAEQQKEERFTI